MKSFLDRFKRKGQEEAAPENALEPSTNAGATGGKSSGNLELFPPGSGTAPVGSGKVPAPVPPPVIVPKVSAVSDEGEVRLELGDFLHRIPQNFLRPGPHEVATELKFDIGELSALIAKGQTTINLAEIYRRSPEIFRSEVKATDNVEVRFPWQKLLNLVKAADASTVEKAGLTRAAAESLGQKLRSRRPPRNIMPGATVSSVPAAELPPKVVPMEPAPARPGARTRQPSWYSKPAGEKPASAATPDSALVAESNQVTATPPAPTATIAVNADYEQKLNALTQERAALTKERDELLAKLAATDTASAGKSEPAEGALAAPSALQTELDQKTRALDMLSAETAALRTANDEKVAALARERDKVVADFAALRQELAQKDEHLALQQNLSGKSAHDAAKVLADRESLQKELETLKAELAKLQTEPVPSSQSGDALAERAKLQTELTAKTSALEAVQGQLAELQASGERQSATVSQERAKLAAELETARRALVSRESAEAKSAEEQETLRNELAERTRAIETLTSEMAALKRSSEEKFAAITHERESWLQNKTSLAAQLSEATGNLAARQKTVVDVERSKKETQRQIDELQRRILAFESGQRETAQELSRERETRIKAERSLGAAERARQETTALLEALRTESRREIEGAARKREAEVSRLQRDLQEKLDAQTEASRKAATERDQLAAELDKLRGETAVEVASVKDALWESRAVASLEEDVANYRARIKTLLAEREEAGGETLSKLAAAEQDRAEFTRLHDEQTKLISEQKRALETLEAKAAALAEDKTAALHQLDEARKIQAQQTEQFASARAAAQETESTAGDLRRQLEKLTGARDALQADGEKLSAELEGVKAQAQQERERFAAERAGLEQSGSAVVTDLRQQVTALQTANGRVGGERDDLQSKLDATSADAERIEADLRQKLAALEAERNEAQAAHRALSTELANARKEHEMALLALRNELSVAQSSAAADLAMARAEHDKARAKLDEEQAAFARTKSALEELLADARRTGEAAETRAQTLDASVHEQVAALRERDAEIVRSQSESENALAALTAENDRRMATFTVEKARALAELTRERDDLAANLFTNSENNAANLAALQAERDEAKRESAALAQRLGAFAVESDRRLEAAERALELATSEKSALAAELEGAREAHKAQSAVFAREFKAVVKHRDDALEEAVAMRADVQEKSDALTRDRAALQRTEAELSARFEREVGRLRRDRDLLIRQRDELHHRIAHMVDEQRQLLEELAAQSARHEPMPNDVMQTPREPRETNVIEISAASMISPVESEGGINLPRIRPVLIQPPNVRVL